MLQKARLSQMQNNILGLIESVNLGIVEEINGRRRNGLGTCIYLNGVNVI